MEQKGTGPGWRQGRADLPAFGRGPTLRCSPTCVFHGGETKTWYNEVMLLLLPSGQIFVEGFEEQELLTSLAQVGETV